MWITRLENSILYEEIEVAADACRCKSETFAEDNGGRWPIFEDRASYRFTGAKVVEFHNSIVS
jgi:hypothetical protein